MYIKRMQGHFKLFVKPITTSHFESFHFKCVTRPDLSGGSFSQLCNQNSIRYGFVCQNLGIVVVMISQF